MRLLLLALLLCMTTHVHARPLNYGPFGDLVTRGDGMKCAQVAILMTSSDGWGDVEERMSRILVDEHVFVIGFDTGHYLREANALDEEQNISEDLEYLYKYVQKTLAMPRLFKPFLVGHADGAAMVYANLVQAPEHTFWGGVALGFRPELGLKIPFGKGRDFNTDKQAGGVRFKPSQVFVPLDLFQAEADSVCSLTQAKVFFKNTPGVVVNAVGGENGYGGTEWEYGFRQAVRKYSVAKDATLSADVPSELSDLPLHPILAETSSDTLAVFLSGDGGWAGLDKQISDLLIKQGVNVVGIDSLRYFWKHRTAEEGGKDLTRIIRHYLAAWHKQKVVLIGYSLGADTLVPFVLHVAPELHPQIRALFLLSPGRNVEFEFHVTDWFSSDDLTLGSPLLPEIRKLHDVPLLCLYGDEDADDSLCTQLNATDARVIRMPGDHHFNDDYKAVTDIIVRQSGLGNGRTVGRQ